jgi:hypothetical protein
MDKNEKRGWIVAATLWLMGILYFFIQKSKG